MTAPPTQPPSDLPPTGRIDIHSHMIPGIDDGCQDIDESLACVRRLIELGYAGSICTPHVVPAEFPQNQPQHIAAWTRQLQQAIDDAELTYRVWPGGELRLSADIVSWMQTHGVPTLAGSRCVLMDFWEAKWPKWVASTLDWLVGGRYQPILAHPERLPASRDLDRRLADLASQGIWLQGNFACMTGREGFAADQMVRKLLSEERYQFMALDMHRPDSLEDRLDGISLVEAEFGPEVVESLTVEAPRRLIWGLG
jgi:protein-tyrosine phosphatase